MEEKSIEDGSHSGYEKILKTIDLVKANRLAVLLLLPVVFIYGFPFFLVWGKYIDPGKILRNTSAIIYGKWILIFFIGIILHELFHGLSWAIYAKRSFRSIRFGVLWKVLTPYCHCKEPLQIKHYIIGAITPFIFVGLLPAIYAIASESTGWLAFGIFYTIGAIGDFMIINLLWKEKKTDFALDHPSEAGCYVYKKIK